MTTNVIPGDNNMSDATCTQGCSQTVCDGTNLILHGMNNNFASANARRNQGSDFVMESQRLSHMRASETVSYREAQGQRAVNESGSGRTRAETNAPYTTGAGGGT